MWKNWKEIETDYLCNGMNYPQLAKKYGIPLSTLKKKAAADKWGQKKQEAMLLAGMPEKPKKPKKEQEKKPPVKKELPSKAELPPKMELPPETELSETEPQETEQGEIELTPVQIAANFHRDRQTFFMQLTDGMAQRISDALTNIDPSDTYSIALLARALKDLKELQGLKKDSLDIEEQLARIAKLRSETRVVEADTVGGVVFMPTMSDRPTPPEGNDE